MIGSLNPLVTNLLIKEKMSAVAKRNQHPLAKAIHLLQHQHQHQNLTPIRATPVLEEKVDNVADLSGSLLDA